MPSRYNKARIQTNNSDYYEPIRKSRGSKSIVHQATRPMVNPTVAQRASIRTTYHTWKYGDRLYVLANNYYGDSRYWWVIAWWNGYNMESQIKTGKVLAIPLNLEETLRILDV